MESGYKIDWTEHALFELSETLDYLERVWTDKEIIRFSFELDHVLDLISKNPLLFQVSNYKKGVHRAEIDKLNTLYYRIKLDSIEILSIFSNRQSPEKIKF